MTTKKARTPGVLLRQAAGNPFEDALIVGSVQGRSWWHCVGVELAFDVAHIRRHPRVRRQPTMATGAFLREESLHVVAVRVGGAHSRPGGCPGGARATRRGRRATTRGRRCIAGGGCRATCCGERTTGASCAARATRGCSTRGSGDCWVQGCAAGDPGYEAAFVVGI